MSKYFYKGKIRAHGEAEYGPIIVSSKSKQSILLKVRTRRINNERQTDFEGDIDDKLFLSNDQLLLDFSLNNVNVFNQTKMYVDFLYY